MQSFPFQEQNTLYPGEMSISVGRSGPHIVQFPVLYGNPQTTHLGCRRRTRATRCVTAHLVVNKGGRSA